MVKKLSKGKVASLIIFSVVVLVIVIVAVKKIVDYINDTENRNFYNYVYSEMLKLYDDVELSTGLSPRLEENKKTSEYYLSTNFRVKKNYPADEINKDHFLREAADLREICIKYSEQHRDGKFGEITGWRIAALGGIPDYDFIEFGKDYDETFGMEENKAYDSISLRDLDKIRVGVGMCEEITLSDLRYFSDCKQIITYSLSGIDRDCDFSEFENLRCFCSGFIGGGGRSYVSDDELDRSGNGRELEEKVLSNLPKGCRYYTIYHGKNNILIA